MRSHPDDTQAVIYLCRGIPFTTKRNDLLIHKTWVNTKNIILNGKTKKVHTTLFHLYEIPEQAK